MKKDDSDKKGKKPSKKPYATPTLTIAGTLLSMINSPFASSTSICCLTERLAAARKAPGERQRLLKDVTAVLA